MVTFTCIFVFFTLIFTGLASLLLTLSLLSNCWEFVSYDRERIEVIAKSKNHSLQWISNKLGRIDMGPLPPSVNDSDEEVPPKVVYLVYASGGVNALCPDLSDDDREKMKEDGYELELCISYLSNESIISKDAWLDRMRNLAMSCAIVSLILLGCSAPLGILGLLKKQISSIMVTGVMYILAAVFGIFTLAFMYFKRVKPEGFYTSTVLDKGIPVEYLKTREFTAGWPSSMGWCGLSVCLLASILWLLLARIMRFQVLSPT